MIIRDAGIDGDGSPDQLDGRVRLAKLNGDYSKQMQRIGMVRLLGQDLLIDGTGLGDPASLLVRRGDPDRLSGRGFVHAELSELAILDRGASAAFWRRRCHIQR